MIVRKHRAIVAAFPTLFIALAASLGACSSDDTSISPRPDPDAGQRPDSNDPRPDAGKDATPPGDAGSPHVLSSDPTEGATDVYPVEIYDNGGKFAQRKRITVRFDAAMDTTVTRATLISGGADAGAPRTIEGVWAPDARSIELTVFGPVPDRDPPLEPRTAYRLDLRALRAASGRPLDASGPPLGDGVLDFKTGDVDGNLNHACFHAIFDAPTKVTATPSASGAPNADKGHKIYEVSLPPAREGFTRIPAPSPGASAPVGYTFYLDRAVPVAIQDEATAQPVPLTFNGPKPPACAGITHAVRFTIDGAHDHNVKLGPLGDPSFKFILELER
ncbi:Ig-like domain-containing protein [Pendulispora albinea]|uniref:Ig-like domain-containing protein n=1 Tax=Pendulispora albinea TaxID=2741071 RepID=A0ABZ2LV02_9BACT